MFRKDFHGILSRCIDVDQVGKVLYEFHEGSIGGLFSARVVALKVMKGGYYWPNLFRDAHS